MPNLNDKDLLPVSFRKGGFTHGGQVHLEGTFAYLPKELAEWDEDRQVQELGDVYWSQGIRRGFTPASESYLAGEYQRRIAQDTEAGQARRATGVSAEPVEVPATNEFPGQTTPRVITGGPVENADDRIAPGGVIKQTGEVPQGYTLQNPQGLDEVTPDYPYAGRADDPESPALAEGGSPDGAQDVQQGVHAELSTDTTKTSLQPEEAARVQTERTSDGELKPVGDSEPADPDAEPFEGARKATVAETREYLAAHPEVADSFLAWEKQRTDREPRKTLIDELS